MPNISHETPVYLLREAPMLAVVLLRLADINPTEGATARDVSSELTMIKDKEVKERRCDTLTLVEDAAMFRFVVVTEVQQASDGDKVFRWPLYLAKARDWYSCAGLLIVICRGERKAQWCRQLIETGHPGHTLSPVVVDRFTPIDPYEAGLESIREVLIMLAVYTKHWDLRRREVRAEVLDVIGGANLETDRLKTYTDMIIDAADKDEVALRELELLMSTEYKATFFDRVEAEAAAKGKAEGEVQGKAELLLILLQIRNIIVSDQVHVRVMSCTDSAQLEAWFRKAAYADSVEAVFGAS